MVPRGTYLVRRMKTSIVIPLKTYLVDYSSSIAGGASGNVKAEELQDRNVTVVAVEVVDPMKYGKENPVMKLLPDANVMNVLRSVLETGGEEGMVDGQVDKLLSNQLEDRKWEKLGLENYDLIYGRL
jgi:hypothetical protein